VSDTDVIDAQLDAALALAAAGFYVFPVDHPSLPICAGPPSPTHDPYSPQHERGKHPVVAWKTGASRSEHNIKWWWKNGARNIGIHCGMSGLLALDEDEIGELARFCADHKVPFPVTRKHTTADGYHYLFWDTEDGALGNREGEFKSGDYAINIRSGNGYVVAPGSVHASGFVYTADDVPIAPLPAWIPEAIRGRKQQASNDVPTTEELLSGGFVLPETIKANHRHGTIVQYAGSLRARNCPLGEAKILIKDAWQRCEQPPGKRTYTLELAYADLEDIYSRYSPGRSEGYQKASNGQQEPTEADEEQWRRLTDLGPHLDGTVERPHPNVGGKRDDEKQVLYPKRWHTVIGLTGCGKTSFALWHVKAVLDAGGHVLYLHFEETDPGGVIDRLRGVGVSDDVIRERFHWASCERRWNFGEISDLIAGLPQAPDLAVLDGINAACSQHGWKVSETEAIGSYRGTFVTPLVKVGAAVLSLGHPPKAKDRQNEMHGFGSTGWLDEVDGVGFRMTASKDAPMITGAKGFSSLYVVKDRYSQVKRWGNLDTTKDQPWFYMGAFIVDDEPLVVPTVLRLNVPEEIGADGPQDSKVVTLAGNIEGCLQKHGGRFDSVNTLKAMLHGERVKFTASDVPIALELLRHQDRIWWPEAGRAQPRPGWLVSALRAAGATENDTSGLCGECGDPLDRPSSFSDCVGPHSGGSE
jgi:hypothetical protein